MDKLKMHSLNKVDKNIKKIAELFPNTLTEVIKEYPEDGSPIIEYAIDFDVLRQELSTEIVEGLDERYQFTWPDKKKSILLANAPIAKTLRPYRTESVDFESTQNLYIEGDNLDALKLLQETYLGKVKMIYIDPPYNTGKDFLYQDNFTRDTEEYLDMSGQFDEEGNRLSPNTESNGRFHTDWLNMIYPRIKLSKDLLSDDGVIFLSIDDNEVENLIKMCNEIFGENNFIDCITWNKRVPKNDNKGIGNIHEYVLVYVKNINNQRQFYMRKDGLEDIFDLLESLKRKGVSIPEAEAELKRFYNKKGFDRGITLYNNLDENYEPWGKINMSWPNGDTFGPRFDVLHPKTRKPTKVPDRGWRWNQATFSKHLDYPNTSERHDGSFVCGKIWFAKDEKTQPSSIKYLKDVSKMLLRSIISLKSDGGMEVEKLFDGKSFFPYPKPTMLLKTLIESIDEKDGIILDFFSGSSTTAHTVLELNAEDGGSRNFIMVQLPEEIDEKSAAYKSGYKNICEIGKERIRRAGRNILEEKPELKGKLDIGFRVLKVDTTNMQDVYYNPIEYKQGDLFELEENIKPDRTPEDLLFQVMLDLGVLLSSKIEKTLIKDKKVFDVANGYLLACFDADVTSEVITEIAKRQPYYAVFRDSSLANDSVATNFEQIFETYSPTTIRKVL